MYVTTNIERELLLEAVIAALVQPGYSEPLLVTV